MLEIARPYILPSFLVKQGTSWGNIQHLDLFPKWPILCRVGR